MHSENALSSSIEQSTVFFSMSVIHQISYLFLIDVKRFYARFFLETNFKFGHFFFGCVNEKKYQDLRHKLRDEQKQHDCQKLKKMLMQSKFEMRCFALSSVFTSGKLFE